ncbi:permease [Crassaminicella thermophila]|uniref:Permease n=1 Tax=Crassaminicella thermophila TaxID=2599308 RepID=A0A5C0SEX8_CRATE|nr:permease [Crassaminicella thermophila]QEK11519.1 permease [Crassaminicella thermophila]
MNAINMIKKNKILVIVFFIYGLLLIFMPQKAAKSWDNSIYYIIEMLEIMPVVFILTALIETWVPKEVIMNSFGEEAGIKGTIFSFILGSFSAGPIYAAFPVCKMLLKKGASVLNIVVILSTWAVVKVPMLANEAKFLGVKFMGVRWVLTTISIFIMGYIVSIFVKKSDLKLDDTKGDQEKDELYVNEKYCVGCGLCAKLNPQVFYMEDGKAKVIENSMNLSLEESISNVMSKCPAKAIDYR